MDADYSLRAARREWSELAVRYDEIVIMTVRDGKVCHEVGVADHLLALPQLGAVADLSGSTTAFSPDVAT